MINLASMMVKKIIQGSYFLLLYDVRTILKIYYDYHSLAQHTYNFNFRGTLLYSRDKLLKNCI